MATAQATENPRWRLELCDHLIALGLLKAETLERMDETEINATARNTYLWVAQEIRRAQDG